MQKTKLRSCSVKHTRNGNSYDPCLTSLLCTFFHVDDSKANTSWICEKDYMKWYGVEIDNLLIDSLIPLETQSEKI